MFFRKSTPPPTTKEDGEFDQLYAANSQENEAALSADALNESPALSYDDEARGDSSSSNTYGDDDHSSPYDDHASPYTVSSALSGLRNKQSALAGLSATGGMTTLGGGGGSVDYLFRDEAKQRGEASWGEKLCYNTGTMYGLGMLTGGAWGTVEGMRLQSPADPFKLRINTFLNAVTRRGPLVGNSVAMFYTSLEHGFTAMRGGHQDWANHVGAASVSGALFKSTAGWKAALRSAAACGGLAAVLGGTYQAYTDRYGPLLGGLLSSSSGKHGYAT